MPLKWRLPKCLLWISGMITFSFPVLLLTWFLINFNLPFLHGGDVILVRVLAVIYWIASGALIFGFRLDETRLADDK